MWGVVSRLVKGKEKSIFEGRRKLLALAAEFIFIIQKLKNIEERFLRKFSFFPNFKNEKIFFIHFSRNPFWFSGISFSLVEEKFCACFV